MHPQHYCLRWMYHHSNLQTMFSQLLEREAFCDVALACEGKMIKAHKIVLSACSTYFDTVLSHFEEKDPIIILKDVKYYDMKCLVEFMYKGEINVDYNHLTTLLKTAEELRIKGLAEVSWRDQNDGDNNTNGVQSALPHVSTVMEDPKFEPPLKRKRGRPTLDESDGSQTTAQSTKGAPNSLGPTEDGNSDAQSGSEHDLSIWEEDNTAVESEDGSKYDQLVKVKTEMRSDDEDIPSESTDPSGLTELESDRLGKVSNSPVRILNSGLTSKGSASIHNASIHSTSMHNTPTSIATNATCMTAALLSEWSDVIKMNDYLNTGRRQQFWEEPFTKRVMDAIKNKNLEMKIAAELLGVSYGTLYGRYRDAYGCLKHPYRIPNSSTGGRLTFWSEQGPTDVLLRLKRKEITLFRAAEQLNVTPQTLSNYLISMSALDSEVTQNNVSSLLAEMKSDVELEDGEMFEQSSLKTYSNSSANPNSNSVLANCPDITIIKKEKPNHEKTNNNANHSDQTK